MKGNGGPPSGSYLVRKNISIAISVFSSAFCNLSVGIVLVIQVLNF